MRYVSVISGHPIFTGFRRLTGYQWDPRDRGVTQANQRIDTIESTLNKKIKNLQSNLAQKFDNPQYSISRFINQ